MSSRGMRMVQMVQEVKTASPTPLSPDIDTEREDSKQYTNLMPVNSYHVENDIDREDTIVNNDISSSFPASASALANYLPDSDDSIKDPDYNLSYSKDAERFESVQSDMSGSDNLSTPDAAASACAKTSPKTAPIQEMEFTKKGNVRKRKRFEKSLQERKEENVNIQRKKHFVRPRCKNCRRKCNEFTNDHRDSLNSQYWLLNWQERRIFISSNVSVHDVKRRRGSENSARNRTFKYFLKNQHGEIYEVCKLFFLATLGYDAKNDRVITNVLAKTDSANILPLSDLRGKHAKTPKTDRDLIKTHVESFGPTVSHYRREHAPNKRYLPSDLTIRKMHTDFRNLYPDIKCSYELYRKSVSKDFNISFATLGHEECETCEEFKLHNPEHTEKSLSNNCSNCELWSQHIKKAKESREMYRSDAEHNFPPSTVCFSADLEKVIMLPRIDMFKRVVFCQRIIVFNESFVPVGKKQKNKPLACLWHECISGRKKEDLISTFHAFMLQMRDKENIIIWLDNCAGQNKNWSLFSYLVYIINTHEISAQTITFRYFEPGHTFMSADSFHHQVEQSLHRMKKVYDFTDFVSCVQSSNSGKVDVKEMRQEDFFIWPDNSSIYKINHTNPRPYLKHIVEVVAKRGSYILFYKTNFSDETALELNFLKVKSFNGGLKKPPMISQLRGIKNERKEMILKHLTELIPENRRKFWEDLPVNDGAADLRTVYDDDI